MKVLCKRLLENILGPTTIFAVFTFLAVTFGTLNILLASVCIVFHGKFMTISNICRNFLPIFLTLSDFPYIFFNKLILLTRGSFFEAPVRKNRF